MEKTVNKKSPAPAITPVQGLLRRRNRRRGYEEKNRKRERERERENIKNPAKSVGYLQTEKGHYTPFNASSTTSRNKTTANYQHGLRFYFILNAFYPKSRKISIFSYNKHYPIDFIHSYKSFFLLDAAQTFPLKNILKFHIFDSNFHLIRI